ncbi:MAG: hypothetical protein ACO25F_12800, partial [Erythrobacter sp.]
MTRAAPLFLTLPLALLAACNSPESESETAGDFAARIGQPGDASAAAPSPAGTPVPPTVYTPRPGAAPGAFVPGTATDPDAAGCGAPKVAKFFGRPADAASRGAILAAVAPHSNVRFVEPGTNVVPDADSTRLNDARSAGAALADGGALEDRNLTTLGLDGGD